MGAATSRVRVEVAVIGQIPKEIGTLDTSDVSAGDYPLFKKYI